MMAEWVVSCFVLLIILTVGAQDSLFGLVSGGHEVEEELWRGLLEILHAINESDRAQFLIKCIGDHKCSPYEVGDGNNKTTIKWKEGTVEYIKERFWQTYHCFQDKSLNQCPVDGEWGSWTPWSNCNATCGDINTSHRTRLCNNPRPVNTGQDCHGFHRQSQSCKGACNTSAFDSQSLTEAKAFLDKIHLAYPHLHTMCLVDHCTFDLLKSIESKRVKDKYWSSLQCYKYNRACPVDGGWGPWTEWTECEPKCGEGTRWRIRNCTNPTPSNSGFHCQGEFYMEEPCFGKKCSKMEFLLGHHLSGWSHFGRCSEDCGKYGVKEKKRVCLIPGKCVKQLGEGKDEIVIKKPCYNGPCSREGGWSSWWEYTDCSADCGVGRQTRIRLCDSPLPAGSSTCLGNSINTRICKVTCSDIGSFYRNHNSSSNNITTTNDKNITTADTVTAMIPSESGDPYYYDLNPKLEHLYTKWSDWSMCTKTCDVGRRIRNRKCVTDTNCMGEIRQIDYCNTMKCSVVGGWSEWMSWTPCSTTCGSGLKMRYRKCDSPFPKYGGICLGRHEESSKCYRPECKEPLLKYGQWQEWSQCSKTCGVGNRSRHRNCVANVTDKAVKQVFLGQDGHDLCKSGAAKEKGVCNQMPCPSAGDWAHWSSWSACSKMCGTGFHYRDRTCTDPAPEYGGKACDGPGSDLRPCFHGPCPEWDDVCVIMKGESWLQYGPLHKPMPYLSLFIIFNSWKPNGLLIHRTPLCNKIKCKDYMTVSLINSKLQLKVRMNGGFLMVMTNYTVPLRYYWNSVYVYIAEDSGFIRVNNGPHFHARYNPVPKENVNYDGIMLVGSNTKKGFIGYIVQVTVNFVNMLLHKMSDWKGYGAPEDLVGHKISKVDPAVKYPKFNGKTHMALPLNTSETLNFRLTFLPRDLEGLLLFNIGHIPGSFFYVQIQKGVLRYCMNCGNASVCENIEMLGPLRWYQLEASIHEHMADIRLNNGKVVQVTCLGKRYHMGNHLYFGGGRKEDWVIFSAILGNERGFKGCIHNVVINGRNYNIRSRPLFDVDGFMNSESLQLAHRINTILEHAGNKVILRCDYTWYKKTASDVSVEWLHADEILRAGPNQVVVPKLPGKRYQTSLTLSASKHKTGVYRCVVRHDGYLTNQHVFVIVRHNVTIRYRDEDFEMESMKGFLVCFIAFALILLCFVGVVNCQRSIIKSWIRTLQTEPQIPESLFEKPEPEKDPTPKDEDDLMEFAEEIVVYMEEEDEDNDPEDNQVFIDDIKDDKALKDEDSDSETDEPPSEDDADILKDNAKNDETPRDETLLLSSEDANTNKSAERFSLKYSEEKMKTDEDISDTDDRKELLIRSTIESKCSTSLPPAGSPSPPKVISLMSRTSSSRENNRQYSMPQAQSYGMASIKNFPRDSYPYIPVTPHESGIKTAKSISSSHMDVLGSKTTKSSSRAHMDVLESKTSKSSSLAHMDVLGIKTAKSTSGAHMDVLGIPSEKTSLYTQSHIPLPPPPAPDVNYDSEETDESSFLPLPPPPTVAMSRIPVLPPIPPNHSPLQYT